MENLIALQVGPANGFRCAGTSILCTFSAGGEGQVLNTVLSTIIGVMTGIAFIWFVFQVFIGAISIIGAEGDKAKLADARAKITSGIVGLIVTISAIFLIDLVGTILGFPILNPAELIQTIGTP